MPTTKELNMPSSSSMKMDGSNSGGGGGGSSCLQQSAANKHTANTCYIPSELYHPSSFKQQTNCQPQMALPSQPQLPPPTASHHHHHPHSTHRSHRAGHRRAKSAGNASIRDYSHYAATGLYAHQSGERLDNLTGGGPSQQQLCWSLGKPIIKKTSSENTLLFDQLTPCPTYYCLRGPITVDPPTHLIKYSSLKSHRAIEPASLYDKNELVDAADAECGCFSLKIHSLQHFAKIQIFVFLCCILVTLQQALASGYFNSVITTIEKRFDISSQMSGAIVSTFELGNLLTIIFVSYFGTHRHIPRWIGTGIVVTAIGSLIFAVPHFMSLSDPLNGNSSYGPNSADNTCRIPKPALSTPFLEKASQFIKTPLGLNDDPTCVEPSNYHAPQMLVFMLAMVLIGCGGTPIFTLGTTYIDDHVPKESASMYMGCMYSMVAFGLVCGFLLGGFFINVHENAFGTGITPYDIFPGHPKWIGAWWAGFILLGVLLLIIAIPFFLFPKSLKPKRPKEIAALVATSNAQSHQVYPCLSSANTKQAIITEEANAAQNLNSFSSTSASNNKKYGRKLGEIPACMWRLATNPIYMVTCLGSCMELAIVSGFLIFLPKYLETQFSLGKSEANLFAGGIAIPGACFGIFLGGYILKRFQLSPKGAIQVVLFFNLLCMGLYTALYFLGCENVRMAGTTLPYANTSHFDTFHVNLTADCNLGCRCSSNDLEPVCDIRNKISYYSPCFAGCTNVDNTRDMQNYSNCACLPQSMSPMNNLNNLNEITMIPLVTPGPCPQICTAMLPFLVLLFVITLVVSITQMPVVMITLRSVAEEERSLALGMQFVLFRLFGYIPSPIVFGNVIDSTCLVWKAHCGQQGGFCLLYNIEQFRLRYVGVCSALKVTAGLLFFLDWLLICYIEKKQMKASALKAFSAQEIVSSIISLDRLSVFGAWGPETITETDEEQQPLGLQDSDYNSALDDEEDDSSTSTSLPPSTQMLLPNDEMRESENSIPMEAIQPNQHQHRRNLSQTFV